MSVRRVPQFSSKMNRTHSAQTVEHYFFFYYWIVSIIVITSLDQTDVIHSFSFSFSSQMERLRFRMRTNTKGYESSAYIQLFDSKIDKFDFSCFRKLINKPRMHWVACLDRSSNLKGESTWKALSFFTNSWLNLSSLFVSRRLT